MTISNPFYVTGGTMRADALSYVERQADKDLYAGLRKGEFCYVLTSRQMGKSSLMARTANRLRGENVSVIALDLTAIGQNLTPEQWYDGLIVRMGRQLRLEDELEDFWLANERVSPLQRLVAAIQEVALARRPGPLVIFVDEIDTVRSLPFSTDEFFAAIRECYNRRTEEPEFNRLTFCLLGVATPSDLIRDARTTPFNIGQRIELTDFTETEAAPLAHGLQVERRESQPGGEDVQPVLARILHWTGGHPYLTQRLCRAIAEATANGSETSSPDAATAPPLSHSATCSPALVDRFCDELFLSPRARERDDNLLFVRERILRTEGDLGGVLTLYERVRNRQRIRDEETNLLIEQLRLAGITRAVKGYLQVRNRIYQRVFDTDWIKASLPPSHRLEIKSVAVLPFVNLSADQENEYLSDGITEDLINALSQVPGLRVPSRTSAFTFKGKTKDIRKIGERLNVSYVVEGSVRKAGHTLRITAQLINVSDGYHLWSAAYDREMADVFAVQDEISRAIVEALKIRLAGGEHTPLIKQSTANAEAYQLYLKGRFLWNQRGIGLKKGLHYFELALLEDPNYAPAYTGLADTYNLLGFYGYMPSNEAVPRATAAAVRALEIDESLAEAHTSLALASLFLDWDWLTAEKEFLRAIELNPNYVAAHYWYGLYLAIAGRDEEAVAEARRAEEIDPMSVSAHWLAGLSLYYLRQLDEAIKEFQKALEIDPTFHQAHQYLGRAYDQKGMTAEAFAAWQKYATLLDLGAEVTAAFQDAYTANGITGALQAWLKFLLQHSARSHGRPHLIAMLHTRLGDPEQAFHWLEKAYAERDAGLHDLTVNPYFDPLRKDPRFTALLTKIGFVS